MLVLAIETSTPQSSVAVGTEQGMIGSVTLSWGRGHTEVVAPAVDHLLRWSELEASQLGGIAVGLGPGLFTGLRAGVTMARTLAQVLGLGVVGIGSLDVLAFAVRHSRWRIAAVVDGKRGEVFHAFYRPVPGGVARETEVAAATPERLAAELESSPEETLMVGNGALLYRRRLEEAGGHLEFASASLAFPAAGALLELALPRFHREESTRPENVVPLYARKTDAELNWVRRERSA